MGFNSLDYIIVAILLLSGLTGYRKGFIAAVGGIASSIAGLVIAFLYRDAAAVYLQEHYGVVNWLAAALEKHMPVPALKLNQPGLLSSLPGVNEGMSFIHRQFAELAYLLVLAGCFLLLYMISSHLLKFLCLVLEKLVHWGILGGINRFAGVGIKIIQNTIILAVILGVINSPLGLGAKLGINGISQATALIQGSVLACHLLKAFAFLQALIGIGV